MSTVEQEREMHREGSQQKLVKNVKALSKKRERILEEVGRIIVGQEEILEQLLTSFFAGGHCVLMAVPGLAKTLMVRTLSDVLSLDFQRVQFTPDLMPTDITGSNILEDDHETGRRHFRFEKGPIFSNILLADEINRTPPKTQAALLEAMQEKQVTSGREIYELPDPFLVLATQNPVEQEGTYVLPEAQLDRFLFMIKLTYSSEEDERKILSTTTRGKFPDLDKVMSKKEILIAQSMVWKIPVSDHVAGYATRLMRATRPENENAPDFVKKYVTMGCSPRAGQALVRAAKANALLHGMTEVACEDVRKFAHPVLRHRILLNFAATSEGLDTDDIVRELLDIVPEAED